MTNTFQGGFLRNTSFVLQIVDVGDASDTSVQGGVLRDGVGALVTTTDPDSPVMNGGLVRDGYLGPLAVVYTPNIVGTATIRGGFLRDDNDYLVAVGATDATDAVIAVGFLRDGSYQLVTTDPPSAGWDSGTGHEAMTLADAGGAGAEWADEGSDGWIASPSTDTPVTNYLDITGFGGGIPDDATIVGVQVELTVGGASAFISSIKLTTDDSEDKGDSSLSYNLPASFRSFTLGGDTDLWGATLTPAIMNDPGFGFEYQVTYTGGSDADEQVIATDSGFGPAPTVTVWYTT